MKQKLLLFLAIGTIVSCNSGDKKTSNEAQVKSVATEEPKMDYAYTIEHPDNWVTGSRENTKMVLQSLKDYEMGNIDAAVEPFADSVSLLFDGYEAKLSKDSLKAAFTADRKMSKSLQINMHDFESVKSKDGKTEYVSMWYTQKWEDQKGKWDSASMMDDVKIINGKIAEIDEKMRHFAKKK
jgi:hypothetical protein